MSVATISMPFTKTPLRLISKHSSKPASDSTQRPSERSAANTSPATTWFSRMVLRSFDASSSSAVMPSSRIRARKFLFWGAKTLV